MTDSPAKARAAKGATGGEERPGWDRLVYAIEIVIFLVLLVVVWAAAVRGLGINALLLPDPVDVWSTGVEFAGLILPQTAYTLGEA
ncbi:MAG TPA: hypothetical protein VFW86_00910, partial [Candidatus Limnocylindrales bacterium]|nr:hypothetical protein [Candidatus Limnocylindrales bacterium]